MLRNNIQRTCPVCVGGGGGGGAWSMCGCVLLHIHTHYRDDSVEKHITYTLAYPTCITSKVQGIAIHVGTVHVGQHSRGTT